MPPDSVRLFFQEGNSEYSDLSWYFDKWHTTVTDLFISTDSVPQPASWSEPGQWCEEDAMEDWEQLTLVEIQL